MHAAAKVVTKVHHTDLIFVANSPDASVIGSSQRHLHEGENMFDPRPSFRFPAVPLFLRGRNRLASSAFFMDIIARARDAEVFGDGCTGVGRIGVEFQVTVCGGNQHREHHAVVRRGGCGGVVADEFGLRADFHVILVTVKCLVAFLGPTGIGVFLR